MIFQSPDTPHSHLTVKERDSVSFPTRILWEKNLLLGEILDFGCGLGKDMDFLQAKGLNLTGFDPHYCPQYPDKQFDTIICNYVLNVLLPEEQAHVLMAISELLKPGGKAYYTVRRDISKNGFRYNPKREVKVYQANVILPFPSLLQTKHCEIYEYQHFPHPEKGTLITETATAYAIKVGEGKAQIFPKRRVDYYFDLSQREQTACLLVLNRVRALWNEGKGEVAIKLIDACACMEFSVDRKNAVDTF